jgi:hypothetical protein
VVLARAVGGVSPLGVDRTWSKGAVAATRIDATSRPGFMPVTTEGPILEMGMCLGFGFGAVSGSRPCLEPENCRVQGSDRYLGPRKVPPDFDGVTQQQPPKIIKHSVRQVSV